MRMTHVTPPTILAVSSLDPDDNVSTSGSASPMLASPRGPCDEEAGHQAGLGRYVQATRVVLRSACRAAARRSRSGTSVWRPSRGADRADPVPAWWDAGR